MRILHFAVLTALLLLFSCGTSNQETVNIYTHRHYPSDDILFDTFTEQTGIEVRVVQAGSDELIERLRAEGKRSPADILITVDAGRLYRAQELGLLQPVESEALNKNIPSHLRQEEGYWFGLTKRARVIAFDKTRTIPDVKNYEDLALESSKGKVVVRSSGNIYNISLLAALIENKGSDAAREWAAAIADNFARAPQGNDRDQMKALIAGTGEYAIVNTYYVGKLLNSSKESEVEVGNKIGLIFPNQESYGTHINVSGAGVTAHSPNKDAAVKLLEFLSSAEAQQVFALDNHEYPVHPEVSPSELVASWGEFKENTINLETLGANSSQAVSIFDEVEWR